MSMTPEQIDAFTISLEQEIEENPVRKEDFIEQVKSMGADLSTPEQQQALFISIAADLAQAFTDAVKDQTILAAERAERLRVEAEDRARIRREQQEVRDRARAAERSTRYGGQEPACGFNSCTLPECYDGTYSNALNRVLTWDNPAANPFADIQREYVRLNEQEMLPQWERELLAPRGGYTIAYDPTVAPGTAYVIPDNLLAAPGDPVLGTQGL